MANDASYSSSADAAELHDELHAICESARAMLSTTSISSTVTASDLPGAGRTLGEVYSYLGKRLEGWLDKFMERRGYGPKAIRRRVLQQFRYTSYIVPGPESKRHKQLTKELNQLLRYTKSKEESNRELACEAVASIACTHPYFQDVLRALDAVKSLALVCAYDERDGTCDSLLSPSRKALICTVDSEMNAVGKRWILMQEEFRVNTNDNYGGVDVYLETYDTLVKCMGSRSPEQALLAMMYLSENRYLISWLYFRSNVSRGATECAYNRIAKIFTRHVQTILLKVMKEPHNVDWTAVGEVIASLALDSTFIQMHPACTNNDQVIKLMYDILASCQSKLSPRDLEFAKLHLWMTEELRESLMRRKQ